MKDLVAWWKQAREELKTSSSKVAEMEGEKLNPNWAITTRSSVLRTHVGQDFFELYKACCLDRDQVLLAQTPHARVEEHLAHVLMQASTFVHNLSLKCLMFRYDKAVAEQKIRELQEGFDHAQAKEREALESKVATDAQVADLESKVAALEAQLSATFLENKKKVAEALESGRTEGFSADLLAGKVEGIVEGRETFLQSEEYKKSVSDTRLQGARDFLKALAFKLAVNIQSTHFLNEGFDKCISQIQHLQGFVEGFDQNQLDSSLDATL
ncbi:hypothetical protein Salat_0859100 [Sesamum alatum]|uniref:Uncharacterized protein n=1 Tax=Sesamum alatum TaxID=300844 RepID=A0AAE2CQN3_9LAMI|nr:hypothetical protein Salat_0859100 [Sesamum alatum]